MAAASRRYYLENFERDVAVRLAAAVPLVLGVLTLTFVLVESAPGPRTTMQSPLTWSDDADWKLDYSNAARMTPEEIAKRRAEFDRQKATAKTLIQ